MKKQKTGSTFRLKSILIALCVSTSTIASAGHLDWGYDPAEGVATPEEWGTLPGNETCSAGQFQSPIELPNEVATSHASDITFNYTDDAYFDVVNNSRTVEQEYSSNNTGGYITLASNGLSYELKQFHFHGPVEHNVSGLDSTQMEMHLVHETSAAQVAVIAVMIEQGTENSVLAPIWDNAASLMNEDDRYSDPNKIVDISAALPSDKSHFSYDGSFTTPPCTEGVEWRVMKKPITMSQDQINAFINIRNNSCCAVNGNNRPTQR